MEQVEKKQYTRYIIFGIMAACMHIGVLSTFCFFRLRYFFWTDMHLPVYIQVLWNVWHGEFGNSLLGVKFFAFHLEPFLFLITPLYALLRTPLSLLILQIIFFTAGGVGVYLIAKKVLNSHGLGFLFAFVYGIHPFLLWVNLYSFELHTFACTFFIFAFWFLLKNEYGLFMASLGLACACNEYNTLLVMMIGLYALIRKYPFKWGMYPIGCALIWYYLGIFYLMPLFNNGQSISFEIMRVRAPFFLAFCDFTKVCMAGKMGIVQACLPFGFFSFLSPVLLLLPLPIVFHNALGFNTWGTPFSPLPVEMIPFIFMAALYGLRRIYFKNRALKRPLILVIILAALSAFTLYGPWFSLQEEWREIPQKRQLLFMQECLSAIPKKEKTIASTQFLPWLAHRKGLYSIGGLFLERPLLKEEPFRLPADTRNALIHFGDRKCFYSSVFNRIQSPKKLREVFLDEEWGIVSRDGLCVLLKKGYKTEEFLYRKTKTISSEAKKIGKEVYAGIRCEAVNISLVAQKKILKIHFWWTCLYEIKEDLGFILGITDEYNQWAVRRGCFCYRFYPSYEWKKGDLIEEVYTYCLPEHFGKRIVVYLNVVDAAIVYRTSLNLKDISIAKIQREWEELAEAKVE